MTPKCGKGALKINKDSHLIKKSSPCSVSKPQQRQPVIIYTHSPRVIQTHPSNFMELVQKLTGLSRSDADDIPCKPPPPPKEEPEDNETASVITSEEVDGSSCVNEVKSSFVPLEPPVMLMPDYVTMFGNIGTDFLCQNKAMFNFTDPSLLF